MDERTIIEEPHMDDVTTCWFCHRPILAGDRAHRSPHGRIAVHTDCLRPTLTEGIRPAGEDVPSAA
jgi:hypothetical protein